MIESSKEFIQKFFLYGALAFTIHLVDGYDHTIAWLYAVALLLGYALLNPDRTGKVIDFFNTVTKGVS